MRLTAPSVGNHLLKTHGADDFLLRLSAIHTAELLKTVYRLKNLDKKADFS